jgi:circadian clock protein KaiC
VMLEQVAIGYGSERRRLRVIKMRGIRFRGGFHDFTIEKGGCGYFLVSLQPNIINPSPGSSLPAATPNSTGFWVGG